MPEQRFKEKIKAPKSNRLVSHKTKDSNGTTRLVSTHCVTSLNAALFTYVVNWLLFKRICFSWNTVALLWPKRGAHLIQLVVLVRFIWYAIKPYRVFTTCSTAATMIPSCRRQNAHRRTVSWERRKSARPLPQCFTDSAVIHLHGLRGAHDMPPLPQVPEVTWSMTHCYCQGSLAPTRGLGHLMCLISTWSTEP